MLLHDITLINGHEEEDGGSVLAEDGGEAVLRGITISNSSAGRDGGGIASKRGSRLDLQAVTVTGCVAGNSGGGLFASLSQSLGIKDSIFDRNRAEKGAGAIEYSSQDTNSDGALIAAVIGSLDGSWWQPWGCLPHC